MVIATNIKDVDIAIGGGIENIRAERSIVMSNRRHLSIKRASRHHTAREEIFSSNITGVLLLIKLLENDRDERESTRHE